MNLLNVYAYLTPIAVTLLVLEIIYNKFAQKKVMSFQDNIANLGTAIWNQCTNLFVAGFVYIVFGWIYDHFAIYEIETTLFSFIILLILFDFLFYWFHRMGHSINILWAAHMPHHSSEEFNLFVGLRASITQRLFSFSFMWPLAIIGFRPEAIYAASAVQLILAYWHHTKTIGKMGWFEVVFNSPSYHRVHHGINDKYLDKNFGEIFIIWDKWFGTCQKEEEEVVFGSLNPVESWSPNKINFQYWSYLLSDAMRTKSWWDKTRLWFMPLGWRPQDCRDLPRKRINSNSLVKFETPFNEKLKPYLFFQAIFLLGVMYFTISQKMEISNWDRFILSLGLWLGVTSWGLILESNKLATVFEPFSMLVLAAIIFSVFNSIFSSKILIILGIYLLIAQAWYFIIARNNIRAALSTK